MMDRRDQGLLASRLAEMRGRYAEFTSRAGRRAAVAAELDHER